MIDFLLFLLGTSGFTIVFILSDVFEGLRNFLSSLSTIIENLIYCPMCLGFWIGLLSSYYFGYNLFLGAFTISIFSWSLMNLISLAIIKYNYIEKKIENEDSTL